MAVRFKDYYEVLGLNRDATPAAIKKAFKKLARKYHPDVAQDKAAAEEKFKEINEAYEVLSDPDKRKKYDRLGENWQHGADFTPPPGSGGFGFDPGGGQYDYDFGGSTGFSDFFENLFGGRSSGDPFAGAYGSHGAPRSMSGQDIESDLLVTLDEIIHGGGRLVQLRSGESGKIKKVKVRIPKGTTENQLIRCSGLGGPGSNGGKPGDLFLRIRFERHPDFRFEGFDVFSEVDIEPWNCVLGTVREIKTPHESVRMKIPPFSQPGNQLRIKNQGLPKPDGGNGDLYLEIRTRFPESLSDEQKAHWEALAKLAE